MESQVPPAWDATEVCARGSGRAGRGRAVPRDSYPRSSSDSKMSVSMRSHSMLVVFKFPSPEAPLFAGNAHPSACAASPELPSRQLAPQPLHRACPERAQDAWSRPPPRPCRLWDGQEAEACTCAGRSREAGCPKKGRRTGCVAAGRGDQATAGEGDEGRGRRGVEGRREHRSGLA